ncbi:hypothetical protein ACHAW5_007271 [Stephanodiscus triporus]|uniref:Uncharacterized protein n=1 Tax=Stephanodiscus triporus TaxID=2934178 RepID=A0ABD3P420_9STRA
MNCRTKQAETVSFGTKKQAELCSSVEKSKKSVSCGTKKQAGNISFICSLPLMKGKDRDDECNNAVELLRTFDGSVNKSSSIANDDSGDPIDEDEDSLSLGETESTTSTASKQLNRLKSKVHYIVTSSSDGGCGIEASKMLNDNIKGDSKGNKTTKTLISKDKATAKLNLVKSTLAKLALAKSTLAEPTLAEPTSANKGEGGGAWKALRNGQGLDIHTKKDLNEGAGKGVVNGITKNVRSFDSNKVLGKVRNLAKKRRALLSASIYQVKKTMGEKLRPEKTVSTVRVSTVMLDEDCAGDRSGCVVSEGADEENLRSIKVTGEDGKIGRHDPQKLECVVSSRSNGMSPTLAKDLEEPISVYDKPLFTASTLSAIDSAAKKKQQQEDSTVSSTTQEEDDDTNNNRTYFSKRHDSIKFLPEEDILFSSASACFTTNNDPKAKKQVHPVSSDSSDGEDNQDTVVSYPPDEVSSITRSSEEDNGMDYLEVEKYERYSARFSEEVEEFVYNGAKSTASGRCRRRRRRLRQPAAVADYDEGCLAVQLDSMGESMEILMDSVDTFCDKIWTV